jgi:hypothetical protein
MNAHAPFAQIEETRKHAAPAVRRSLSDIIAEYDDKADSIAAAIAAFNDSETAINTAASIGGTFGSTVFSTAPRLYEKDVRIALLRSAWEHVYDGLDIAKIASANHGNTVGEWHDLPVGSFSESGTNILIGFCVKHVPK